MHICAHYVEYVLYTEWLVHGRAVVERGTCMEDRLRCCWIQTLSRPHELQIIHEVLSKTDNTPTWYLDGDDAVQRGRRQRWQAHEAHSSRGGGGHAKTHTFVTCTKKSSSVVCCGSATTAALLSFWDFWCMSFFWNKAISMNKLG